MQKLKQQQLFDRILEKLPDHVTLLLVILSGFLLARLTWMLFPADPALMANIKETEPVPAVEVIPANARPTDIGKEIAGYHLLGVYQPPQAPAVEAPPVAAAPAAPAEPEKPRDPIKLVGVYALPDRGGVAVIDIKGQQRVVGVGETIEGNGAVLEKVYSDKVELSWEGKAETLEMPKMTANAGGAGVAMPVEEYIPEEPMPDPVMEQPIMDQALEQPPMEQPIPQPMEPAPTPLETMPQGQAPDAGGGTSAGGAGARPPATGGPQSGNPLDGASLASFRQQVAANNMKLLELVRPSPVSQQGQLTGFRVTPGSNPALFGQTGLQPGDIVTEINGTPLNSNASSLRAMQNLMNSANAQLTVLRAGQVTSISVAF